MEISAYNINLQIYAKSEEEADKGRKAIIQFIEIMRKRGAAVSGDKLAEAVNKLGGSPFILSQIIQFFKS